MLEFYTEIKFVHIAAVLTSGGLFALRGLLFGLGQSWVMAAPVRYLVYAVDTVLLTAAAAAAILEETIVVGYLVTRLEQLKWGIPAILIASALLRGSYHLYQGWPMALGNVAMGLVFAFVFIKRRRLLPLMIAHFLLDFVSFVGPTVIPHDWLVALGLV